jgi:hypothetical protein
MAATEMNLKSASGKVTAPLLPRGVEPAPGWSRLDYFLAGALVLVGLALRIPGLNQGLWIDEIQTLIAYVREPVEHIILGAGHMNNHVLYSLIAHHTVGWFGESAWALRLPAVVFGVAALPALYYLGRQLAGRQEAFLAALFMALNYQYVWYSQNARGYTGLLFGVLFASILFIRLLATTRPSARLIVGYAVVAALSAWMQLTAVFVVLVHGLVWLALASKPNRAERFAAAFPAFLALFLAGALTLALYAPLLGNGQGQLGKAMNADGAPATEQVSGGAFQDSMMMQWNVQEYAQGVQRSIPGGWPVVLIVVFVLLSGIGSYLRQGVAIAALLLLPALLTFLLIYWRTYYFFPRFLFGASGFLLLVGVRGGFVAAGWVLPFLSRRQVLLVGSFIALAGTALVPAAWQPKQDFVAAAQFIEQHRAPGDGVICLTQTIAALKQFLGMDCEPAKSLSELIQIEAHYERAWLIYTLPRAMQTSAPGVMQRIQQPQDYATVKVFPGTLSGGDIIVLLKQSSPSEAFTVPDAEP